MDVADSFALNLDELQQLASLWSDLNGGLTPSEIARRLLKDLN